MLYNRGVIRRSCHEVHQMSLEQPVTRTSPTRNHSRSSLAQSTYQPTPENQKARENSRMPNSACSYHWGVYSVLGNGEWILHDRKLTLQEYERLPQILRS